MLAGRMYEARVRARASVGQWSDWSHVVTWQTEEGESKNMCRGLSFNFDIFD